MQRVDALCAEAPDPKIVGNRLLVILRDWVRTCVADFNDKRMMKPFKIVTAKIQSIDKECAALVKEVEQSIFSQLTKIQSTEKYLKKEFEAQMKVKRETISRAGGKMVSSSLFVITSFLSMRSNDVHGC